MKKLISILLAVAMLACFMTTAVFADEVEETVSTASIGGTHVTAETGASATVSVSTSNATGFCAYKYVLTYDSSKLTVNSVSGTGVMSNTGTPGSIIVTFQTGDNVTSHSFSVNFTVNGGCGTYGVGVSVSDLYAFGANSEKVVVPYGVSGGSVTVNHIPGDKVVTNEVAPTCTVDGGYDEVVYCSACGEVVSSGHVTIPATGHKPGEEVVENEVAATCTTDGSYDIVTYCTVCKEELSRETITVPGGHKWDTEWTYDKETHWHECSVCHEHCDHEEAHQTKSNGATRIHYEGASATEDGLEVWQCLCGYTWEEVIPADPNLDPDIPPTGDITDTINMGAAAILVTMMGAVALVVKRKTV